MGDFANDLYDEDFYAWTRAQATALRALASEGRNLSIDVLHLAEEVEDLGKDQRNACRSQVRTIIEHLLKLELSPASEPRAGWERTILLARAALDDRLTKPLELDLEANLDKLYAQAATLARQSLEAHGEHEAAACIPANCPCTLDDIKGR
jgi:hypothetical protein